MMTARTTATLNAEKSAGRCLETGARRALVASRPEAFLTSGAMPLGNCPASAGGCRLFQKTLAFLLFNPTRQPRVTGEVRGLLADRQWSPNGHPMVTEAHDRGMWQT